MTCSSSQPGSQSRPENLWTEVTKTKVTATSTKSLIHNLLVLRHQLQQLPRHRLCHLEQKSQTESNVLKTKKNIKSLGVKMRVFNRALLVSTFSILHNSFQDIFKYNKNTNCLALRACIESTKFSLSFVCFKLWIKMGWKRTKSSPS
jgi:hypothetical protein